MCAQHLQQLGTGSLSIGHRHIISDRLRERERGAAPCPPPPCRLPIICPRLLAGISRRHVGLWGRRPPSPLKHSLVNAERTASVDTLDR
jgi:hypothetical protein